MITNYLGYLTEEMKKNKQNKMSDEEIKKNYKEQAEKSVRWHLIKSKIINENDFDVKNKEIQKRISELKEQSPNQKDQIDKYYKEQ